MGSTFVSIQSLPIFKIWLNNISYLLDTIWYTSLKKPYFNCITDQYSPFCIGNGMQHFFSSAMWRFHINISNTVSENSITVWDLNMFDCFGMKTLEPIIISNFRFQNQNRISSISSNLFHESVWTVRIKKWFVYYIHAAISLIIGITVQKQ